MSSRSPLWFCHECHAETRPLMVPDPHCASCNGTFVEKMDDPLDDPRQFQHPNPVEFEPPVMPSGLEALINGIQTLTPPSRDLRTPANFSRRLERTGTGPGLRIEIRSDGAGTRTFTIGGPSNAVDHPPGGGVPTMSEFVGQRGQREHGVITGPLMMQYLLAMMAGRGGEAASGLGSPEMQGRMGDYVFNQEALDHVLTTLMEGANSSRPVPATENIISDLPREVLEIGSPTLGNDCAVCKEQFKLQTEDPDEQVVVSLPCKHIFHEACIVPWLNSSGTCPVCRYALVAQPNQPPPVPPGGGVGTNPGNRTESRGEPRRSTGSPSRGDRASGRSGFLGQFFGSGSNSRHNNGTGSRHDRSRSSNNQNPQFPGNWGD